MLQAIRTKSHAATNTRGYRVTATAAGGCKITVPHPHNLDTADAHRYAAEQLCKKLNWPGEIIGGALKDGYCFVFAPETAKVPSLARKALRRALAVEESRMSEWSGGGSTAIQALELIAHPEWCAMRDNADAYRAALA